MRVEIEILACSSAVELELELSTQLNSAHLGNLIKNESCSFCSPRSPLESAPLSHLCSIEYGKRPPKSLYHISEISPRISRVLDQDLSLFNLLLIGSRSSAELALINEPGSIQSNSPLLRLGHSVDVRLARRSLLASAALTTSRAAGLRAGLRHP